MANIDSELTKKIGMETKVKFLDGKAILNINGEQIIFDLTKNNKMGNPEIPGRCESRMFALCGKDSNKYNKVMTTIIKVIRKYYSRQKSNRNLQFEDYFPY